MENWKPEQGTGDVPELPQRFHTYRSWELQARVTLYTKE